MSFDILDCVIFIFIPYAVDIKWSALQCTVAFPMEYVNSYLCMELHLLLVLYGCPLREVEGTCSDNN